MRTVFIQVYEKLEDGRFAYSVNSGGLIEIHEEIGKPIKMQASTDEHLWWLLKLQIATLVAKDDVSMIPELMGYDLAKSP